MPKTPAHRVRRKPPWFRPVPLRERRAGWSEVRQCTFLAELYLTGSVTAAARRAVAHDHARQRRAREAVVQLGEGGQAVEEGALLAWVGGGTATQAEVLGVGAAEDRQDTVGPGGQRRAVAAEVTGHPHHMRRAAVAA